MEWRVTTSDFAVWIGECRVRMALHHNKMRQLTLILPEQKDTVESFGHRSVGAAANHPLVAS